MELKIVGFTACISQLWIMLLCFTVCVVQSTLIVPTNEKITVTLKGGSNAEPPFQIVMDDVMKIDNPEYPTHPAQIEERGQTSTRDVIDIAHGAKASLKVTKFKIIVYQQKGKPSNHFIPAASIHMVCGGSHQPEHCSAAPTLAYVTWKLVSGHAPVLIIANAAVSEHNPVQGSPEEISTRRFIEVNRETNVTLKLAHFRKVDFRVGSDNSATHSVLITRSGVIGCHTDEEPPRCAYEHNAAKSYLGQPTLLI